MIAGIGHNRPPPDEVAPPPKEVEPFDLRHKPMLAQMGVDGIVAVIQRLEAELVPMREAALLRHQNYRGLTRAWGVVSYAVPIPGGFDQERFRELKSVLADCRIELRERRSPGHPEARPSEHEKSCEQRHAAVRGHGT